MDNILHDRSYCKPSFKHVYFDLFHNLPVIREGDSSNAVVLITAYVTKDTCTLQFQ